jgi:hypothetical protein
MQIMEFSDLTTRKNIPCDLVHGEKSKMRLGNTITQ